MKYYNIELLQTAAEKLQQLLYDLQVKFEILLNKNSAEFNKINEFLMEG